MAQTRDIINICDIRYQNSRPCKDCIFYGKECNRIKKILKLSRPSEYINNVEARKVKER